MCKAHIFSGVYTESLLLDKGLMRKGYGNHMHIYSKSETHLAGGVYKEAHLLDKGLVSKGHRNRSIVDDTRLICLIRGREKGLLEQISIS